MASEMSLMDKELLTQRFGHDFPEDVLICSYHNTMLMTKFEFLQKTFCNVFGKDKHAIKQGLRSIDISDADELKFLSQAKSFATGEETK
ncbi:hypothetical protein FQA39_LY04554 [Lamprigera yunnana]|nr:hypothetical protein FQA39_LY04554 [Lamprigera yunnana]